jgi:hypothetical protein
MPRISKTEQELNYLRSAWEEIEYARVENNFSVTIVMVPTISRGVWSFEVRATSLETNLLDEPIIHERAVFRFPNGRLQTFAGELWNVLHRFNIQLEEARDKWTRAHK